MKTNKQKTAMPVLTQEFDVEISVYCSECGAGICASSTFERRSSNLYTFCPVCKKANEDVQRELEPENDDLRDEIEGLKRDIERLEKEFAQ